MGAARQFERLTNRQARYEKRVDMFSGVTERRSELFERARQISEMYDAIGLEEVTLQRSEKGHTTTARIYGLYSSKKNRYEKLTETHSDCPARILLDNGVGTGGSAELMGENEIVRKAKNHAHDGMISLTPLGVASRALSIRLVERRLNRFSDALYLIESAAADPILNPELAKEYKEIDDIQSVTPEQLMP